MEGGDIARRLVNVKRSLPRDLDGAQSFFPGSFSGKALSRDDCPVRSRQKVARDWRNKCANDATIPWRGFFANERGNALDSPRLSFPLIVKLRSFLHR